MLNHERDRSLLFRFATLSDVGEIVELVESAYRGHTSRTGWTTEANFLEGQRTDAHAVREMIDKIDTLILLALFNHAIVGCCQLVHTRDQGAYFGMFAIRPGFQGLGLGTEVLTKAERVVRKHWGARAMKMTVIRQREELVAWYRRKGYEPTGETVPFPYGDERFGIPLREDLEFIVLEKSIEEAE